MASAALIADYWSHRNPREQAIIGFGAFALVLLAVYFICVDPAASGVSRLRGTLPNARTQAAQLDALIAEARGLRALPQAALPAAAEPRSALDKSLVTAGLSAAHRETTSNGDMHFTFVNVPYGKWTSWLATAERGIGVHPVTVEVKAAGTPGNANIELSLRLPRSSG
jgi:general secretion pathway protein M